MPNNKLTRTAWLAAILLAAAANAGPGPENICVVVNADSFMSRTIANEYVALRDIPPDNVVFLAGAPDHERINVEQFRETILKPVLSALEQRRLGPQIDGFAYSSDLPTEIVFTGDMPGQKPPQLVGTSGAITGLTYLALPVLAKQPQQYTSLANNRYWRAPRMVGIPPPPPLAPELVAKVQQAQAALRNSDLATATALLEEVTAARQDIPDLFIMLAMCRVQTQDLAGFVKAVQAAADAGYTNWQQIRAGDNLKQAPGFADAVEKMKANALQLRPATPLGFRSSYGWNERGERVAPEQNARYLLATMLGVTSGRGNSLAEVIANLQRNAAADGTMPKGTFYFLANSDVRAQTRTPLFAPAIAQLQEMGLNAVTLTDPFPKGKTDILGLMAGVASFNWDASGNALIPGAIAEHLTSFGGIMRYNASQTPISAFIRAGAAGTAGTIIEPLAIPMKFPSPFVHPIYAAGATMAEAIYMSVTGPYQLLVLGDPLCRPWAQGPNIKVTGPRPTPRQPLRDQATWEIKPSGKIVGVEAFLNGRRIAALAAGQNFDLDTTTIADGYHDLRLVPIADHPLETRGETVAIHLFVANRGGLVSVKPPQQREFRHGETITLPAAMDGAEKLMLMHHCNILATINADRGQFQLDAARLDLGPVTLRVVAALLATESQVDSEEPADTSPIPPFMQSPPLRLTILPPPGISPASDAPSGKMAGGAKLTRADGEVFTWDKKIEGKWLHQAGVKPNEEFTIAGYWEVDEEAVGQIQLRHPPPNLQMMINQQPFPLPETGKPQDWRFVPVFLKPGRHHVTLRATTDHHSLDRFDIRLGVRGATPLALALQHTP